MEKKKTIWFKRKLYGYGWQPCTWQGWALVILYFLFIFVLTGNLIGEASKQDIIWTFAMPLFWSTLTLIFIAAKFGEKPRWQWGKRIEDEDDGEDSQ